MKPPSLHPAQQQPRSRQQSASQHQSRSRQQSGSAAQTGRNKQLPSETAGTDNAMAQPKAPARTADSFLNELFETPMRAERTTPHGNTSASSTIVGSGSNNPSGNPPFNPFLSTATPKIRNRTAVPPHVPATPTPRRGRGRAIAGVTSSGVHNSTASDAPTPAAAPKSTNTRGHDPLAYHLPATFHAQKHGSPEPDDINEGFFLRDRDWVAPAHLQPSPTPKKVTPSKRKASSDGMEGEQEPKRVETEAAQTLLAIHSSPVGVRGGGQAYVEGLHAEIAALKKEVKEKTEIVEEIRRMLG